MVGGVELLGDGVLVGVVVFVGDGDVVKWKVDVLCGATAVTVAVASVIGVVFFSYVLVVMLSLLVLQLILR